MSEMMEWLRSWPRGREVADEIERLRIKELELIHVCEDKDAEIERLRAALEQIADDRPHRALDACGLARRALEGK